MDKEKVLEDSLAFESIKENSRPRYKKVWPDFKSFVGASRNWDESEPTEDEVMSWAKFLWNEKKASSSTMWTTYSMLNAVIKSKYNMNLKKFVRVTALIKSYDTDVKKKASCFSKNEFDDFIFHTECSMPYWLVGKAVAISSYFGGLHRIEAESLLLEDFVVTKDGIEVTHSRSKQRSDCKSTKFLIPRTSSYADIVESYLERVREDLGKRTGRVWYTGRQDIFVNSPMGKNFIAKIPHDIASKLNLDDVDSYTFHSFRRTSASNAADQGASALQMQQHFGWKNVAMAQEYMSTSKVAIKDVAQKLASRDCAEVHPEGTNVNEDAELEKEGVKGDSVKLKGSPEQQAFNFPSAA